MKIKLENADPNNVKLCFITRDKKHDNIQYNVLQTEITREIGFEFINMGLDNIRDLLKIDDLKTVDYCPLLKLEQNSIQIINKDKVAFLNSILEDIQSLNLDFFNMNKTKKLWAYAVSICDSQIILFRKYNENKILNKTWKTALIHKDGKFDKLEGSILTIDNHIDCIYFDKQIYILQPTQFENIFSFVDEFTKDIESSIEILNQNSIINDTDNLWNLCKTDPKKIKKLYKILKSDLIKTLNPSIISTLNNEFNLNLIFDSNNYLIPNKKNIWTVLKVLDDDYLNSHATGNKYETHSKVKK